MPDERMQPESAVPAASIAPPTAQGPLGRAPKQVVWPNVLGVIGVIYAVGGILINGGQAMSTVFADFFSATFPAAAGPNPMEAMQEWAPLLVTLAAANVAFSILLMVGCFGLLMHRPWGSTVIITWATIKLVAVVANAAAGAIMGRDMMAEMAQQGQGVPFYFSNVFVVASLIMNTVLYSGFPVFMLIWLNLKGSKREVAKWRDEQASAAPA